MALASVALDQARTLLNDDIASVWSDTALLPKLKLAHQELQTALWEVGSQIVREESGLLAVAISAVDLGASQPADLLVPLKLFEYDNAGAFYGEMTEVFYIPKDVAQTAVLTYWAWREDKIIFLGSSAARKVVVQYRKLITVPTTGASEIGITFGELYLGPRTAALAAGSTGNGEVLTLATAMAKENLVKVLDANRGQQNQMVRP